jgi:antibiotic biosynthesis monooxygenase (ABM) superfamily enzyme
LVNHIDMEHNDRAEHPSGPITIVVTRDIFPGRERDYEEWALRLALAADRYGATGHTIITPDAATPTRRVFVHHFPDEEAMRSWEESEERNRLVEEADEFSAQHYQRASGLETWFTLPGERAIVPPPRWKQRAAVTPVVLLSLMTYVVMPLLTRLFRGWLYPHQ